MRPTYRPPLNPQERNTFPFTIVHSKEELQHRGNEASVS
jgi:hypothetical protein